MADPLIVGAIHHVRLTVTDVARSQAFYTQVLGVAVARAIPTGVLLTQGSFLLGLGPAPDPAVAPPHDQFSENRVGLDHLSFQVADYAALAVARDRFAAQGVPHGEIKDIGMAHVLAFRGPDNIQATRINGPAWESARRGSAARVASTGSGGRRAILARAARPA